LRLPDEPLPGEIRAWNPQAETRQDYLRRTTDVLNQQCEAREKGAKMVGLSKTDERREIQTFFWLAGFQVRRWSANAIADARRKNRRTVEQQINWLADDIGLSLRPRNEYDGTQSTADIRDALLTADRQFNSPEFRCEGTVSPASVKIFPPAIRDRLL
jgi:hypothetical protein